jgi:ribosomal protein L30
MTADKKTKSGAEGTEDVKPTVKKAAATKKPAAKKAAAEKPAADKKPAVKKPAAKKAAVAKDEPVAVAPQPAGAAAEAIAAIEEMAATAKPAAKKAAAKKASTSRLRITQVRSQIGFARAQRKVLAGLGLGRIGKSVLRHDDPCIRGMVAKVAHLVRVEEVEA